MSAPASRGFGTHGIRFGFGCAYVASGYPDQPGVPAVGQIPGRGVALADAAGGQRVVVAHASIHTPTLGMTGPIVAEEAAREWETWPDEQLDERGRVAWKTLIGADVTPSDSLTLGIAVVRPGEPLRPHRHAHAEIYLMLEGTAVVMVDGMQREVSAGAAVFIPGDARHSIACATGSEIRFAYAFAADSMDHVHYVFD